jgi:hypothetical protein
MGKVSRREWVWAAVAALLVMGLTSVPYVTAAGAQTEEWRFSGFLLGVEDGNSYIAKMGQGARGDWLFTLSYSSEPQRGAMMFGFHFLLGKLAGPEHDSRVVVYHAARIVFGFLLLLVSYRFLAEFLPAPTQRRIGWVLVALGGGLGWLLLLLGQDHLFGSLPIDFYSPEAYTFLTLYTLPHLAASRCLFLLGILAYLRGRAGWAGLALLAMSLIQPLYVLSAWAAMGADLLLALVLSRGRDWWPRLRRLALTGALSCPVVIYSAVVLLTDPVFRQWNAQNILPSPNPVHYLLGYGLLLVVALFGWPVARRDTPRLAAFAAAWLLVVPILLYAPLGTQRRLVEGIQLPLVALAILGLTVTLRKRQRLLVPLVLALALPSSALLLAGGWGTARTLAAPVFRPGQELRLFQCLTDAAKPGQVALSSYDTGNALPTYTPLVAYVGHGPETVFLAEKLPRVAQFYRAETPDAERRQLLRDGRIRFVLLGPSERLLGGFDPASEDYLRRVDCPDAGEYAAYEVVP